MAMTMQSETTQPSEKCCLMFTDIVGSTELIQSHGDIYPAILSRHYELLRSAINERSGHEIRTFGDSIFAIFPESNLGVHAAIDAQHALHQERWAHGRPLMVRMGLHNGIVQHHEDDLLGIEVHRAARIGSVAHGGQIVISSSVRDDIKDDGFPPEIKIRDLGYHRLKDLRYPELLFDLEIPGLPHDFERISSLAANRSNLPSDISDLFGRRNEVDEIKRTLLSKERRLVTLTGTGGTGKTSLALIVGKEMEGSFARGAFMVQLGDVDDADLIGPAISQTLGIHEQPGVSALDSIRNLIGDGELLLILDTFEHVIEGAGVVTGLLSGCPNLSIIVTSREALRLKPEIEFQVTPLPVPAPGAGIEDIAACESVELFLRYGHRERPDLALTADNAEPIAAICRRLDGLPLAIELAASRMRLLEPSEIAERLMTRLSDLSSRSRDLEPRHRTLYSTIEWSDNLLTERERRNFYKLSVFSGGFDLAAARAVLGENKIDDAVIEDSDSLISKSLLFRSMELGRPRLDMLDTIRQYASDELKRTSMENELKERHALYFSGFVASAAPKILKRDQRNYVEALFQELGNVRAALRFLVEQPSAAETARLLEALKWFWISRGLFSEALNWTELALKQARQMDEPAALASILDVTAWIR